MAEKRDPKDVVTLEELTNSNMYEIGALVELLEQQGVITKQEILDMIQELRRKTPQAERLPPHLSRLLPFATICPFHLTGTLAGLI